MEALDALLNRVSVPRLTAPAPDAAHCHPARGKAFRPRPEPPRPDAAKRRRRRNHQRAGMGLARHRATGMDGFNSVDI